MGATDIAFLKETTSMTAVNTSSETGRRRARLARLHRDEHMPAGKRQRSGPPARYTAWLLGALAALALLVTIVNGMRNWIWPI
jgi:hypothetical protein